MSTKTNHKKPTGDLEKMLRDAQLQNEELRARVTAYERIIQSTRMIMGHELKRPTNAIRGYLDLVCEDLEAANDLATLAFAEKARNECDLLNDLNSFYMTLLDVHRNERRVGRRPINVSDLIKRVLKSFPGDMKVNTRVDVDIDKGTPEVIVSEVALKIIVHNLVENALLYSQSTTPISVRARVAQERRGGRANQILILSVRDEGVGIPTEYEEKVFSPFVRLRDDVADGSGLGLTLVRSLAELNGGEVSIVSRPGDETIVHVTLPIADSDDEAVWL